MSLVKGAEGSDIHIADAAAVSPSAAETLAYLGLGIYFGIVLIKSEVVSWYRIQEMFRFDSFHMYGVLASAVATAAASLLLLRRLNAKTVGGEEIRVPRKEFGSGVRYAVGGTAFGLGWALTGACPAPIVALVGYGVLHFGAVLAAALFGTWTYGVLRLKLPH